MEFIFLVARIKQPSFWIIFFSISFPAHSFKTIVLGLLVLSASYNLNWESRLLCKLHCIFWPLSKKYSFFFKLRFFCVMQ